MGLRDDIIADVRPWVVAANPGLASPDRDVFSMYEDAPRVAGPRVGLSLPRLGQKIGHDERYLSASGGDPIYRMRGTRNGTLQLFGYGDGSLDLIENASDLLDRPDSQDLFSAVTVRPIGESQRVAAPLDTDIELRWVRDFDLYYEVLTDEQTGICALIVQVDAMFSRYENGSDPVTLSLEIDTV